MAFTFHVRRTFNLLFEMFSFIIVIVVFRWHYSVTIQIHHNPISIWHAFDEESEKLYLYVIFFFFSCTLFCIHMWCIIYSFKHSIQHVLIIAERKNIHFSNISILNLWKQDTLLYCIVVFRLHSIRLKSRFWAGKSNECLYQNKCQYRSFIQFMFGHCP